MSQERRISGRRSTDRLEQVVDVQPNGEAVDGRPGTFWTTAARPGRLAPRVLRGTVLLVDGDPASLAELSQDLLGSEYRVIRAADAASALDVLGRDPVDVIVVALELEGPGGLELLGRARARRPEAVRIVLTEHPDVASAITAINREEVFRYLCKPVGRDQLLATVHQALERRWAVPAPRVDTAPPIRRPAPGRPGVRLRFETGALAAPLEACRTLLQPESRSALPAWVPSAPGSAGT